MLEETDRMLKQVDDIIKSTPEVSSFSRRLGTWFKVLMVQLMYLTGSALPASKLM
jgi:hypothetical protein